jgi:type IV secretion system protein VirB2
MTPSNTKGNPVPTRTHATLRRIALTLAASSFYCGVAYAQAMPWDGALQQIQSALTGTTARALGAIALAVSGGMLAFGGELNEFTKRLMMVVMAISIMLLANNIIGIIG